MSKNAPKRELFWKIKPKRTGADTNSEGEDLRLSFYKNIGLGDLYVLAPFGSETEDQDQKYSLTQYNTHRYE